MEFELFFSDINDLGGPDNWQQNVNAIHSRAIFKSIQKQRYKLTEPVHGVYEHHPVLFTDHFAAMIHCQILTTLVDFRFSPTKTVKTAA